MRQVREGGGPLPRDLTSLLAELDGRLREIGFRLNRVFPKDGSEAMTQPAKLAPFTTATRPAAASWAGALIYVSDGAAGAKFQGSDGTAWVNLG
jgi:hypothetical protein